MRTTVEEPTLLIDAIAGLYPNTTRAKLRRMLTEGRILVEGRVQHRAKHPVEAGQTVEVTDRAKGKEAAPPPTISAKHHRLSIVYEDEAILVVDKPAGLLSVATNKMEDDTLHSRCVNYVRLSNERAWIHIVHRLDRDISKNNLLNVRFIEPTTHWSKASPPRPKELNVRGLWKTAIFGLKKSNLHSKAQRKPLPIGALKIQTMKCL